MDTTTTDIKPSITAYSTAADPVRLNPPKSPERKLRRALGRDGMVVPTFKDAVKMILSLIELGLGDIFGKTNPGEFPVNAVFRQRNSYLLNVYDIESSEMEESSDYPATSTVGRTSTTRCTRWFRRATKIP